MNPTWLYVAVVYAGSVALARRAGIALPRRVALLFYTLVLLFLFRPMTQDFVNLPMDFLRGMPPWAYTTRDWHVLNSEINDLTLQIVPWAHQVRESWKSLEAPLWNSMNGSGYPLLANGQSSALSLVRLIALPLNLGHAMTAEAAMKLLIALTFTFLYCRGRGRSELASAVAAVTFSFSGFMVGWLHFPLVTAACFAPAILYCVDRLSERQSFGRIVFTAGIWAAILFAGHPETAAHLFWLFGMYGLWVAFVERGTDTKRMLASTFAALAIAGLLALPYLAPLAEAIPKSRRYTELKHTANTAENLPYRDRACAILLLQPNFLGQVPFDRPWGPALTEPLGGYAGVFGVAAWIALFFNTIATRSWRSREAFYVLATLFILGSFMGWPGFADVFHMTMPLAAHARLRLLFVLLLAIQSASAIDLARRVPLLLGILSVAVTLFLLLRIPLYYQYRFDTAVLAMLPSIGVLALATLAAMRRTPGPVIALFVAVIAELWSWGYDRNPTLIARQMYPPTPMTRALDALRAKEPGEQPFRITGLGPMFFPNVNVPYGYEDVRVHDPMGYGRYIGFLANTVRYDAAPYFATWDDDDTQVLDYLNVKYLIARPQFNVTDPGHFELVYNGRDARIFENRRVLPRFFPVRNVILEFRDEVYARRLLHNTEWASTALLDKLTLEEEPQRADFFNPRPDSAPLATTRILEAGTSRYRLHASAPRWSMIVSSIPWWPGWKIERNGKRIEPIKVNGVFLGFAVPPGESEIRVWYSPWTFWAGVWVSVMTMAGLAGFAWRRRRARVLAG